ncbi:MAG TPA: flagellar type III secretion system pore protein FliP [Dongiaceae bacterium]|jgi:flagellar biosynthetic protein FliP|nr:flagellar type III secretion system pore protein FliP [Dongiaceae bacterium]
MNSSLATTTVAGTPDHLMLPDRRLKRLLGWLLLPLVLLCLGAASAHAQSTNLSTGIGPLQITLGSNNGTTDVDSGIKILFFITLISLAPSILLLMTCFTRVAIVLSFVRTALQLQGTPANQIIIGLSLFITYFIMAPVWENINHDALEPYQAHAITSEVALDRASGHIRTFMLKQTRPKDVELFVAMAKMQPTDPNQLPLKVVIPAFIISELRTAFQMGFLIFIPFILIDLVVATVLMSMGMMMMPPMTISLPLKLLLFVLVDGWTLVVQSLVRSFGM